MLGFLKDLCVHWIKVSWICWYLKLNKPFSFLLSISVSPCSTLLFFFFPPTFQLSFSTSSFLSSSAEADDLAQYLDHLLAHAAPKKPKRQIGGLGRFKAVATKTKEMVTLMSKAQNLDVQSELILPLTKISQTYRHLLTPDCFFLSRCEHVPAEQAVPLSSVFPQPEPPRLLCTARNSGVFTRPLISM